MKLRTLTVLCLTILLQWKGQVAAQTCSFSMTDLDFGTIDPTTGQNVDGLATLSISCSGIPTNQQIRICAHICQGSGGMDATASTRYMTSGSAQLQYNIYRQSISTGVWGARGTAGTAICGSGWSALNLVHAITASPDNSGNYSTTVSAYGRIFGGQSNLAAGTYVSSFANGSSSRAAASYALFSGTNCGNLQSNITNFPFTARATVVPTCNVTATPLNFGTATLLDSDIDQTATVSVTCTASTAYSISLNQGTTTGGTTTTRLMKHASSSATIPYQLFSDAPRSQNWGNSAADDVNGTGTGSAVNHTVYGRVPGQAVAPQAGSYSDTITVTVIY